MRLKYIIPVWAIVWITVSCSNKSGPEPNPPAPSPFNFDSWTANGVTGQNNMYNVSRNPSIKLNFSAALNRSTTGTGIVFLDDAGLNVAHTITFQNGDKEATIKPNAVLDGIRKYTITLASPLKSATGGSLSNQQSISFITTIDSSRKFPTITNNELLDKVQQQTFKYFWDHAHPTSGLTRERLNSGNTVTSGGSGFGIMAIITGIHRNFITKAQGLARMQTMVAFLKNNAIKVKGAFPHWLNGATGAIIPFSANDNGADLVETSYLMMGLLTARQYFNGADAAETTLRADINSLYNNVEWDWFRQGGQNVLYWHYSPDKAWIMNLPIRGWNECLITYVLAASSTTHGIPPVVYTNGWKGSPGFTNGNTYYGHTLPLGPAQGGPLFFSHYSFLGINPNGLTDASANYATQVRNHTLINYNYCKTNPKGFFGYSDSIWGLTASDIPGGYSASSPTNDLGVIAPTAALSSFPYTPAESMAALQFFYYVLGNKLFKEYGFIDAFSLKDLWFADSFLAIDQGPIIIMIENHRSKLLWDLFTSCPEVKAGMLALGFSAPYL